MLHNHLTALLCSCVVYLSYCLTFFSVFYHVFHCKHVRVTCACDKLLTYLQLLAVS